MGRFEHCLSVNLFKMFLIFSDPPKPEEDKEKAVEKEEG